MAKVIEITNPLTGQPQPVVQSDYTAQQIDDSVERALPGGAIDASIANRVNSIPILVSTETDVFTYSPGYVYVVEGTVSTQYNHPINSDYAHLTYVVFGTKVNNQYGYEAILCFNAYGGVYVNVHAYQNWVGWVLLSTQSPS